MRGTPCDINLYARLVIVTGVQDLASGARRVPTPIPGFPRRINIDLGAPLLSTESLTGCKSMTPTSKEKGPGGQADSHKARCDTKPLVLLGRAAMHFI